MNFNTPIARTTPPTYAEGSSLADVRDSRNTSALWKKARTTTRQSGADNTALANIVQRLNKLQRRQIGYIKQTPSTNAYPFQIYNVGGNTFQVRDGIIGYRSAYFLHAFVGELESQAENGSWEIPIYCPNTDFYSSNSGTSYPMYGVDFDRPHANNNNPITVTAASPALLSDSNTLLSPCSATMAQPPQGTGMTFWVEITDDPTLGLFVRTYAQVVDWTGTYVPYPITQNNSAVVVPIGFALWNGSSYDIQQYQIGNLINRYLPQCPQPQSAPGVLPVSSQFYTPSCVRGYWSLLASVASGLVGYPGEIYVDDVNSIATISGHNFYGTYVYSFGAPGIISPSDLTPSQDGSGDFSIIASVII